MTRRPTSATRNISLPKCMVNVFLGGVVFDPGAGYDSEAIPSGSKIIPQGSFRSTGLAVSLYIRTNNPRVNQQSER